jgi:hypothetical protein
VQYLYIIEVQRVARKYYWLTCSAILRRLLSKEEREEAGLYTQTTAKNANSPSPKNSHFIKCVAENEVIGRGAL